MTSITARSIYFKLNTRKDKMEFASKGSEEDGESYIRESIQSGVQTYPKGYPLFGSPGIFLEILFENSLAFARINIEWVCLTNKLVYIRIRFIHMWNY